MCCNIVLHSLNCFNMLIYFCSPPYAHIILKNKKSFLDLTCYPPPYILKTRFFIILSTKNGVSKSVPQKWTVYPKIFIHYKELDHTGTLSFILPIGQITFFHFFFDLFFQDIAVVIFLSTN